MKQTLTKRRQKLQKRHSPTASSCQTLSSCSLASGATRTPLARAVTKMMMPMISSARRRLSCRSLRRSEMQWCVTGPLRSARALGPGASPLALVRTARALLTVLLRVVTRANELKHAFCLDLHRAVRRPRIATSAVRASRPLWCPCRTNWQTRPRYSRDAHRMRKFHELYRHHRRHHQKYRRQVSPGRRLRQLSRLSIDARVPPCSRV